MPSAPCSIFWWAAVWLWHRNDPLGDMTHFGFPETGIRGLFINIELSRSLRSASELNKIEFVSQTESHHAVHNKYSGIARMRDDCVLRGGNDWQLLVDFDHRQIVFPAAICVTNLRPDIVIWSLSCRSVHLIELTCPAEENIGDAASRNLLRYESLCSDARSDGWGRPLFYN